MGASPGGAVVAGCSAVRAAAAVVVAGTAFSAGAAGVALAGEADTVSLHAVVLGPFWPGGAPPGSGTQAFGLEGSVSLTPGWLGPSQA